MLSVAPRANRDEDPNRGCKDQNSPEPLLWLVGILQRATAPTQTERFRDCEPTGAPDTTKSASTRTDDRFLEEEVTPPPLSSRRQNPQSVPDYPRLRSRLDEGRLAGV